MRDIELALASAAGRSSPASWSALARVKAPAIIALAAGSLRSCMIALRVAGSAHLVAAVGGARDRVGIAAEAERRPGLLHGGEPGLLDELIKPLGEELAAWRPG